MQSLPPVNISDRQALGKPSLSSKTWPVLNFPGPSFHVGLLVSGFTHRIGLLGPVHSRPLAFPLFVISFKLPGNSQGKPALAG